MPIVARGVKLAIDECQAKFSKNRWNCSLIAIQESIQSENNDQTKQSNLIFGEVIRHPNKERSFLNAIIAAGLAHAMTKACSQGELPEECNCDRKIKSKNKGGKIEWIACSDDIDFGAKFSRDFTDSTDTYLESETTLSMINTHNYEVGRRVFKSATDITCTCQQGASSGNPNQASPNENINPLTGLCQTKKCWKHLGAFSDIGDELVRRYESATHVQLSNKDPHKLRPVRRGVRKPKRKDLVYIDESPDYCTQDTRLGVLGTQNRHCNSTSSGPDSCSLLCCGRGYQVVVEEIEEDCNCKFVWCCQVKCDRCKKLMTNDVCN